MKFKIFYLIILIVHLYINNIYSQDIKIVNYDKIEKIINEKSLKTKIINFWATWCIPCVQEIPFFLELNKELNKNEYEFYFVSLNSKKDLEKVKVFCMEKKMKNNLYLLDNNDYNSWIDRIEPNWSGALPFTLVVHSNGIRKFTEKEFENKNELKKLLTLKK